MRFETLRVLTYTDYTAGSSASYAFLYLHQPNATEYLSKFVAAIKTVRHNLKNINFIFLVSPSHKCDLCLNKH